MIRDKCIHTAYETPYILSQSLQQWPSFQKLWQFVQQSQVCDLDMIVWPRLSKFLQGHMILRCMVVAPCLYDFWFLVRHCIIFHLFIMPKMSSEIAKFVNLLYMFSRLSYSFLFEISCLFWIYWKLGIKSGGIFISQQKHK